jgi:hypothetical protein
MQQSKILIMSRALSWYQIDCLKNGDHEMAKEVALLLHELLHNVAVPSELHNLED